MNFIDGGIHPSLNLPHIQGVYHLSREPLKFIDHLVEILPNQYLKYILLCLPQSSMWTQSYWYYI